jgi:tRNA threonylcarbamoyladenosine biosynthesis protein TsaE
MGKKEIIKKILPLIFKKRIFLLEGKLGAGKTTLTKIIARKLKIKEKITSPTFILWQKYDFQIKNKKMFFNHIDLYRVQAKDILKLDLRKEIFKKNNIFFIEWGAKLKPFLNKNKLDFVEIYIQKNLRRRNYFLKIKK